MFVSCLLGKYTADPTSGSLREGNRRGMLVMPARRGTFIVPDEVEWIIKRNATDLTSRSLRKNGRDKRVPPKRGRDRQVALRARTDVMSLSVDRKG